jgi:hypothetical protein
MNQAWDTLIKPGRDKQALLYGAGSLAAAVVLVALGGFGWTFSIGRLALPSWSMYAVGGIAFLVGIAFFLFSQEKCCRSCGEAIQYLSVYLPLESEPQLQQALQSGDSQTLLSIEPVPKNQMKMELDVAACSGCGKIARLDATKWQDFKPHPVAEDVVIQGDDAVGFRQLGLQHAEWRGEDE